MALPDRLRYSAAWWIFFWGPGAPMRPQTEQERTATRDFLDSAIEFYVRQAAFN